MLKFIIFVFIPILLFSQNPRDYFPTHLGDMWQYIDSDGMIENYTIIKDSVDTTGNEFVDFKITWPGIDDSSIVNYMIDTLDQVWEFDDYYFTKKFLIYKLRAKPGEWYYSGTYYPGNYAGVIVYDTTETTKTFLFYDTSNENANPDSGYILEGALITLKKGLGRVHEQAEFTTVNLNGAIINGVQYGTIYYDTTAIPEPAVNLLPTKPEILKTYPNPFNSRVKIEYYLPESGWLKIEIFSVSGQKVATLFDDYSGKGKQEIVWDGNFSNGLTAPSGIYFIHLKFAEKQAVKRILLIK